MVENVTFSKWLENQLSFLLGFPPGEDLVKYILAFESAQEIREHFSNLLDLEDSKSKHFLDEFFKRWSIASVERGYQKTNITNSLSIVKTKKQTHPLKHVDADKAGKRIQDSNKTPTKMAVDTSGAEFLDKNKTEEQETSKKGSPFKKKNLKYVPLYGGDGKLKTDTALLPGRSACQCLAQRHRLINNCIECGRIVCEQEGSGPCMFCGNLVCTPEEQEIITKESKRSKKLMEKLLSQSIPGDEENTSGNDGLQKAIAHKEKLLEFDKNCTKRTKVIDDEADYFAADDRWMTKQQKSALKKREKELREKRFASRHDKKFTIDFAGRKIMDDNEQNYMYEENVSMATPHHGTDNMVSLPEGYKEQYPLIDPRISIEPPKFSSSDTFKGHVTELLKTQQNAVKTSLRLQDKGLQEIVDRGMCLSMHQPWASLLVHGVKKLEGRSWYSAHRGRLWIASTAKPADEGLIKQVEMQFRNFYPNEQLNFPEDYPCSALLGCVNVIDCLSSEEYYQQHPASNEESGSAYLFVCENAQGLKIKFSMKGKHKIYKLESHIHAAAKKNLQPS